MNHPEKTPVVGQNVKIPCYSANSNPVNWWYQRTEDKPFKELVVNGNLVNSNSERFSLNPTNYDLTLLSAKWDDRGIYTCVEETAFGTRHITHLTVRGMCFIGTLMRTTSTINTFKFIFCWKLIYNDIMTHFILRLCVNNCGSLTICLSIFSWILCVLVLKIAYTASLGISIEVCYDNLICLFNLVVEIYFICFCFRWLLQTDALVCC